MFIIKHMQTRRRTNSVMLMFPNYFLIYPPNCARVPVPKQYNMEYGGHLKNRDIFTRYLIFNLYC